MSKAKVFISIATGILGGPGKGLVQFLRCGGLAQADPVISNFLVGEKKNWQFRDEIEKLPVPFIPLRQTMTYDPFLVLRGYRVLKDNGIQLLQSHGYKSNILCTILKLITGLPHIAFMHGWTAETWKIRVYQVIDLLLYRFADRVVIVSEALRPKLRSALIPDRHIVCIKNAVEPSPPDDGEAVDVRKEYGLSDSTRLICVIGRLSPEKGQLHFIESMQLIARHRAGVVAILVGDGQDRPLLERRARELGVGDRVIFAGYQQRMAPFYRCCDLVVMPSLSEGMPNVALEAMSFGKPLVATRVGGIPEVVLDGETGILVPAADPRALAQAVSTLLDDGELSARYVRAGRQRVADEFCPEKRARRILALYREILSTQGGAR